MPTRPEPLPDTWSSKDTHPEDHTPLGRIDAYATDHLTLTVPSTLVDPDPPAVPLAMPDLRVRLMREGTPHEALDRTWRHLGEQARAQQGHAEQGRAEQGDWNLFALGTAYPGLRNRAKRLNRGRTWDQAVHIHHSLIAEFLFALHRLDLTGPYVFSRLLGAAYDQTSGRKRQPEPVLVDIDAATDSQLLDIQERAQRQDTHGGPGRVLDRLVRQTADAKDGHRITGRHAALIRRTYLAGEKLGPVAAEMGIGQSNASKQRARAAYLIANLLGRPDLAQADTPPAGDTTADTPP